MIYGEGESVLFYDTGKHHAVDHPGKIDSDFLEVQILDEKRESLTKSSTKIEKSLYDRGKYICMGNVCMNINQQQDSYEKFAENQKEQLKKDDEDEDNWLKAYAEKSYKEYERFQEEYFEDSSDEYSIHKHTYSKEDFEEAISISGAEPEKCEKYLTVPEFANNMLRHILEDTADIMPIVRRIRNKEIIPLGKDSGSESSGDMEFISESGPGPSKSEEYFAYVAEPKKNFSSWPSIEHFTIQNGALKIDEYLASFDTEEDWLYVIYYQGMQKTHCSDLFKYQAIYSLPTWRYPIAQATASIYFVVEVCKAKPKHCPVDVTFQYETYRNVFKPGHLDFNERWLHHILDAKINLFKTVTY